MTQRRTANAGLRKLASCASPVVAVCLVAVKFAAWMATGSVALLASAVDALVDTGSSLVAYFGIRYADRLPDTDHRFGHGKGEAIAGLTQATFLAGAGLVLALQSVDRLIFPEAVAALDVGIVVIVCSLVSRRSQFCNTDSRKLAIRAIRKTCNTDAYSATHQAVY